MSSRDNIPFINDLDVLIREFNKLYQERLFIKQENKKNAIERIILTKQEREVIYYKTGGLCHICGNELEIDDFSADHVKPYSQKGTECVDNFLPSCHPCNGYRWNYKPEEIQWIFKLGVWLKTKIQEKSKIGILAATEFLIDETERESRRKNPRSPMEREAIKPEKLFPIKGKYKKSYIEASHEEILKAKGIISSYYVHPKNNDFFNGNSFVITGESNIPRLELKSIITEKGGVIKKQISKNIDFLVIGNFYGLSKILKIEKINSTIENKIKIIMQDDIIKYNC